MSRLTFEKFVDATRVVASDLDGEDYLPTYLDPDDDEFLVLEGVPPEELMQSVARNWAEHYGCDEYFLGYQEGSEIVAEHYLQGRVAEAARIQITDRRS